MEFFKKIFSITDIDSHYVILILGIQIRIKHKVHMEAPTVTELGVNEQKRNPRIIVSLTTFPERINVLVKTISTLMNQTLKPDEIILWLADEQFPDRKLPEELTNLQQYGLWIRWCNDMRSFKKLIPTMRDFPNDIVITVDDDLYYAPDTVETLYNEYLKNPKNIYAHRAGRIRVVGDKLLDTRTNELYWKDYSKPSFANAVIGCGGVLYPPHCMYQDILNEEIFKKVVPTQDDIWFWAMAVLNGTKTAVVKGYKESLYTVEDSQQYGLCKINEDHLSGMSRNEALDAILEQYPNLIEILNNNKD